MSAIPVTTLMEAHTALRHAMSVLTGISGDESHSAWVDCMEASHALRGALARAGLTIEVETAPLTAHVVGAEE